MFPNSPERLTSATFPSGQEISYSYWLGRLDSITEPGGVVTGLAYDAAGRLAALAKGAQSVTFTYDGSLPTSVTYAGGLVNQTISTTYNADFLPSSVTYAGGTANYLYDNDGLLTQAGAFTIERDAETGWPTSVYDTATTVMTVTPSYNAYGEVTGADTTVNSIGVASWDVTYDDAGRIAAKTETVGGTTATYVYSYDAMSRLTEVSRNGLTVEEYAYDGQGRRTTEFNSLRGVSSRAATYDDDDRLETSGDYAYAYDVDGFLAMRTDTGTLETTTYAYARNGQLNSVTLPDDTVIEYVHNAAGQRVAKKINGAITEKYLWAGITGLLAVYDGANNLVIRFEGAKMVKNGQTYYLITDQVGSIRAVCDASGSIVKEIAYDSFGNILADTNPSFAIPLGFAGGLHDRDTGLVRFGFRDYDPDSGRWTAKDPVQFSGGSVDFYTYCSGDPVGYFDMLGLDPHARTRVAVSYFGSEWWAPWSPHGGIRWVGKPKCNLFVYDVLNDAGEPIPLINGGKYPPTASQWADSNVEIGDWIVVKEPKTGDVISTGKHLGIVLWPSYGCNKMLTITAAAAGVVRTNPAWPSEDDHVVYRRPRSEL